MQNLIRLLALSMAFTASAQAATAVTTSAANLLRQPALGGVVLRVVPRNTLLIVACSGSWCRTTYQDRGGYVARSMTRPVTASAPLSGRGSVFYRSCRAMRAAGKAPLSLGQLGYRTSLDRDHNGLACERGE